MQSSVFPFFGCNVTDFFLAHEQTCVVGKKKIAIEKFFASSKEQKNLLERLIIDYLCLET